MKKYLPLLVLFLVMSLSFGLFGYLEAGYSFYDALLAAIYRLFGSSDLTPSNPLIEAARWLSFLFSAGIIYGLLERIVSASYNALILSRKAKDPKTIAIHGDSIYASYLAKQMGRRAIHTDNKLSLNAHRHVLLFKNNDDALLYLSKHFAGAKGSKQVFVRLEGIHQFLAQDENTSIFSIADMCAQEYWSRNYIISPQKVVIIGSGLIAENLLRQALLVNLFSIKNGIDYVAIGDFEQFKNTHTSLEEIFRESDDTLTFPGDSWYEHVQELRTANRIILCDEDDDKNLQTLSSLLTLGIPQHISNASAHEQVINEDVEASETARGTREYNRANHIDSSKPIAIHLTTEHLIDFIYSDCKLREYVDVFGTNESLITAEMILDESSRKQGKKQDISYRKRNRSSIDCCKDCPNAEGSDYDICLACGDFQEAWHNYDEFTRQSNYALADHVPQKVRLLKRAGIYDKGRDAYYSLSQEVRDELQCIEHKRWNRFHYLNNWKYGKDGKDPIEKTHHYLTSYENLPRNIKDYDADPYLALLENE